MRRTSRIRAKWTDQILDEVFSNLGARRPGIAEKLPRVRELMNRAVPDALVTDCEPLIEGLKLPDPHDRHVLAAAIKAGAQIIVTANVKDFPRMFCSLGAWRSRRRMSSSSIRSTSTTVTCGHVFKRSQTPGTTHRRPWMTYSMY
ncbi:PIN domain-containing protein [Actinoallomurus sp. NPDC052308]|uniref:PIN domain-containing protein n=1 Tax=Actinoallomurus sp. NPDC052308 TaxID=3155530 RepID=UPI003442AA28